MSTHNTNEENTIENWDDITNIKKDLLRGIYGHGFENPSPIQKQAIIPMVKGNDIVSLPPSWTGVGTTSSLLLVE